MSLSPDTQAVADAIEEELWTTGDCCLPSDRVAAATLRAAVRATQWKEHHDLYLCNASDLLAIAEELDPGGTL
jgi:hypothetical protein